MEANDDYVVSRRVLNKAEFNIRYAECRRPSVSFKSLILQKIKSFDCLQTISGLFPFYQILASFYNVRAFSLDILSGLTMSILHVPQGMAYGYLAGLQPINGLYTSFFPALIYFVFGTSRNISIGTFSIVALLSSEPVDKLSARWTPDNSSNVSTVYQLDEFRLQVAVTVTILSGLIQLAMGLFRLGWLVMYISSPLLGGFTCASGVHVLCSQLNGLFGIRLKNYSGPGRLLLIIYHFFKAIRTVNLATLIISVISIIILTAFKFLINPKIEAKIRFPFPIELIVLILGTIVSHFAKLEQRYNVKIVGNLPQGLPKPILPNIAVIPEVALESFVVSFVALATTVSLVKLYATRNGYDVQYTKEMSALGLANIFGGFFRCHAASGALARTSVAHSTGMQSQVASLVSCLVLLLVLTVLGPLLESVPMSVLSSLIAVSLTGILAQIHDLPKLYRISITDMLIWLVTFLATIFIDVPLGLLVGLIFSLLTVLYRTHISSHRELQRIIYTDLYVDKDLYEMTEGLSRILILRFGGPLYFANAETFQHWIYETTGVNPENVYKQTVQNSNGCATAVCSSCCRHCSGCLPSTKQDEPAVESIELSQHKASDLNTVKSKCNLRFIILDVSSWGFVDVVGANVFCTILRSYQKIGVDLLFTCCEPQVRNAITNSGLSAAEFDNVCYMTLHDAVVQAEHILCTEAGAQPKHHTDHLISRF